ncbi:MAG: histidine phosphatase family protein [Verrucomicrobiales bacterium]|nr:histidine phosphatase family protein [Verrucomicrobiales bacterium]
MKQLLLIRHGKSDWDHPGLSDHDRVLNERGLRDAPRMADALKKRGISPDLIVTSTATRAATTASLIAEGLGYPCEEIIKVPDLYLAPPRTILRVIQALEENKDTVLVFGHNPGMHEAVNLLSEASGVEDFPTLAMARIEVDVEFWGEAEWGSGLLVELLTPRSVVMDSMG